MMYTCNYAYKSKTEDLLVYTKSLILSQNARFRYTINQIPKVAKEA